MIIIEFIIATNEVLEKKTGDYLLTLMNQLLTDNGFTTDYQEFNEIKSSHPMGDNSLTEEIYFQSKITKRNTRKKSKKECDK